MENQVNVDRLLKALGALGHPPPFRRWARGGVLAHRTVSKMGQGWVGARGDSRYTQKKESTILPPKSHLSKPPPTTTTTTTTNNPPTMLQAGITPSSVGMDVQSRRLG